MRPAATRPDAARVPVTLYLAFELGNTEWKLAMTTRIDQAPLVRTIPARELAMFEPEIARAKTHFGVSAGSGPTASPTGACAAGPRSTARMTSPGSTISIARPERGSG